MTATDARADAHLSDPPKEPGERPLPASAPLVSLRDRIAKARAARFLDLDVPGVEGVFVRYLPLGGEALANIWGADLQRADRPVMERHAMTLTGACAGIFERQPDGSARSVHPDYDGAITKAGDLVGDPVKFYADLGELLTGERPDRAVDSVFALYVAEGDVKQASDRVIELSGFARGPESP